MENKNKNKKSSQEQNLLFKKYYILSRIDEGSFGSIYLAKNVVTNENVAIKVESRKQFKPLLEREAYILFYLRGPGLPQIKTFGKTHDYFILVQTLLGPSLSNLIDDFALNFTVKDICMLSIQMLERLEYIHSKNYIHRDIKPHNFLMGLKDPNMVYIIDFGLSKKYRSKKGNHIKFSITNNIIGTPRYCSINALRGAELSRKDDLESLFYVILYLFRGNVPWQNLKIRSRNERFKKINEIKKKINYKLLCKNLPEELHDFGIYIKNLHFEEDPNYRYMEKLFYSILSKINEQNDDQFSWIKKNLYKNNNNSSIFHKSIFKEKGSSHKRLYEKIYNSLEKKLRQPKNNIIISTQRSSFKDNITLASLNIDNKINNNYSKLKKSSSYGGLANLRVINLLKKNEINNKTKPNFDKDNLMKNKNNDDNYNYNFNPKIKRNATAIKARTMNSCLMEDNNNNDYAFNTNNNEPIKNIFLRSDKIKYISPNLVLNLKKNEKSQNNNLKNKSHSLINKDYNSKNLNGNNKKNKIIYNNYMTERHNIQKKKSCINNLINKDFAKIKNNNNFSYKNICSKNNVSYNNENKYINTYNGENIKLNLEKPSSFYRTNSSTNFPISNTLGKKNYINLVNNSLINKTKSYGKKESMNKKRNINLNIKLINNNNFNNVPLIIYNAQSNKLNNIKYYIEKGNSKIINKNKANNNIKQIYNITNPVNSNRVTKYTTNRKTITSSHNNLYNSDDTFPLEDEIHNKIKIMGVPKRKTNLDKKNLSLFH